MVSTVDKLEELKLLVDGIWNASEDKPTQFVPVKALIEKTRDYLNGDIELTSVEHLKKTFEPVAILYERSARGGPEGARYRDVAISNPIGFNARNIIHGLEETDLDSLREQIATHRVERPKAAAILEAKAMGSAVFLGHGGSHLYHEVLNFLSHDCGVKVETFERNKYVGGQIIGVLQKMLDQCGFAVVVATAEDAMKDPANARARQNVVHEIGLFQGRLGFDRVAILRQDGIESWSNIDGLLVLPFKGDDVKQTFLELQRAIRAMGLGS